MSIDGTYRRTDGHPTVLLKLRRILRAQWTTNAQQVEVVELDAVTLCVLVGVAGTRRRRQVEVLELDAVTLCVLVGVAGTRRRRQVEVLELDVGDTECAGRCCWYAPAAPT